MTAKRLSVKEVAEVTGANPKTIRAYLRRNATRDQEVKGSRWGNAKEGYTLTAKVTALVVEHFTPAEEDSDKE